MSGMFRVVAGAAAFTIPITMTVMDVFGYVAKVEGASMQVSLCICLLHMLEVAYSNFFFPFILQLCVIC